MLKFLNYDSIMEWLSEISDNGDMYGYENKSEGEYYQEYKELFDELSGGAWQLWEAMQGADLRDNWDDMTVALLGETQKVLGFDVIEQDYFGMLNRFDEEYAVEKAVERIERLTKRDMIRCFRKVMVTLLLFFDIKAAHDCLTSIVEELDTKGALLQEKVDAMNRLYRKLDENGQEEFDTLLKNIPKRMWVE
jgi:hypothetical protein